MLKETETHLKPCPFCGGEAEIWRVNEGRKAWVACMGRCAVLITRDHITNAEASESWNTRADPWCYDMESAPKEKELDLWVSGERLTDCWWAHTGAEKYGQLAPHSEPSAAWVTISIDSSDAAYIEILEAERVQAWMPLPAQPQKEPGT